MSEMVIETAHDCLVLLKYLKSKFLENQERFESELYTINCIGQVAVDLVDRNCSLADNWIKDWMSSDSNDEESKGHKKEPEKELTFYDFIVICEIHTDSNPDVSNTLRELEALFLPQCSLLSDSRPSTSQGQDSARNSARKNKRSNK